MLSEIWDAIGDLQVGGIIILAVLVGLVIHVVSYRIALKVVDRTEATFDARLVARTRNPMRLLVVLASILVSTLFMDERCGRPRAPRGHLHRHHRVRLAAGVADARGRGPRRGSFPG